MENLYETIMKTTTICCLGITSFLMLYANRYVKNINYHLENSRKLVKEFRVKWDSSINNLNKSLTNLEGGLGELHNNLIKLDKEIIYLNGLVDGASLSKGYNEKSLE